MKQGTGPFIPLVVEIADGSSEQERKKCDRSSVRFQHNQLTSSEVGIGKCEDKVDDDNDTRRDP